MTCRDVTFLATITFLHPAITAAPNPPNIRRKHRFNLTEVPVLMKHFLSIVPSSSAIWRREDEIPNTKIVS